MATEISLLTLFVLLMLLIVAVQVIASRFETAAVQKFPPVGQFVTVEGRQVHAVVTGEGPDLVLIHGASGNARDMTFTLAESLSDRYRVIVLDRPGLGYTDRVSGSTGVFSNRGESPAQQARLLQAAAAQLGARRPLVMGHSYGGAVALAWALEKPDNIAGLIDVAGVAYPWPGPLYYLYRINGTPIGGALLPPLITAFAKNAQVEATIDNIFAPQTAPDGYSRYVGAPLTIRRDSLRANARQVYQLKGFVAEMAPHYPEITIPVEIVHGDADMIVPIDIHSRPLAKDIPGAHLTVLPGVGHMPHHSNAADVIAAIDRAAIRAGLS